MPEKPIRGQLNSRERELLARAVFETTAPPKIVLEVGTWLGGGSTIHLLRALEERGEGHLWGIEADRSIYDQMIENISLAAPEASHRFTPLFGFSQEIIPKWLRRIGPEMHVDMVFLDGGDNPLEQITEFQLLADRIPVGGQLLSHDAKLRKGRWLVPYVSALDNWASTLHDISDEGLFYTLKVAERPSAQSADRARRVLSRLQRSLVERVGAILPSKLNAFLLRLLPGSLAKKISQGR